MKQRFLLSVLALCGIAVTAVATAPKGVFSVGNGVYVTFADENYAENTKTFFTFAEAQAISVSGYRILDKDEWTYLLVTRDAELAAANQRNGIGTVAGTHGLIIIPDNWTQPSGVPALTGGSSEGWNTNSYDATEWTAMAAAGAVFLPAAGYSTNGTTATEPVSDGTYWSSTEDESNTDKGYAIQFENTVIHNRQSKAKTTFYSVRLAKTVQILDEADEQTAYDDKYALAKDKDYAYVHRTLYKDGYFNTLCLPFDVPDISASPLAGAEVFTFESGEVVDNVLELTIAEVTSDQLTKGVPYLVRWASGTDITETMYFSGLTSWDDNDQAGTDPGSTNVKYHGFYYKTHISDQTSGTTHYNLFLGANNELYWPTDGSDPTAKMSGFRAHFYILPNGSPSQAPLRPGMYAILRIRDTTTGVESTPSSDGISNIKQLRDGQIVIRINGETYTLGGQRL